MCTQANVRLYRCTSRRICRDKYLDIYKFAQFYVVVVVAAFHITNSTIALMIHKIHVSTKVLLPQKKNNTNSTTEYQIYNSI